MAQKILTIGAGGLLTEINDAYQGTVTSVAAITLGTTGTDLSSTVATGTTTPVISLQVPTASAANRGALSATDWSTFNGKAPLVSPSFTTPSLGVATATSINFGGTTLSAYDEGTWTPVIAGSTTPGTQTYYYQKGSYTRIGRLVMCQFSLYMATKDAATAGTVRITGLPFTSNNTASQIHVGVATADAVTYPAGATMLIVGLSPNVSYLDIQTTGSGVSTASLAVSGMGASGIGISGCISYIV